MKAYLKSDLTRLGEVVEVYTIETGQKRLIMKGTGYEIDAEVSLFELSTSSAEV